jgi:hypothetical protein
VGDGEKLLTYLNSVLKVLSGLDIFSRGTKRKLNFVDQCYYSALVPVLAGTRAKSGDRYGSGTLHSGKVLRGSLPLLSPAFRRSHFRRQMPPRPQQRERS